MQITIPDDDQIQEQAIAAGFESLEAYVLELLQRDADRVAILEGLKALDENRVLSVEEVDTSIRKEFGIPPRQ